MELQHNILDRNRFEILFRSDNHQNVEKLVEVSGIEPLTSCMPCKRSPS
jgi:hypothetical protein